jgi:hypothetical protein
MREIGRILGRYDLALLDKIFVAFLQELINKKRFLLRSRTCLGGLPDKSRKPYWNPVKRPDISGLQNQILRF